ncbi:hypothetical protein KC929_02105 [Patescibacteria group bacterium]|nr:hypothetical protein [Patescibacteria group bacterium]
MSTHEPSQHNQQGFVILFSILVSSIILLLSAGIFNVVQKEVVLSSYARESQRAFYAADSALECALYADVLGIGEPPATPFTINPTGSQVSTFDCGGDTVTSYYLEDSGGTDGYDYPYVFRYYNSYGQGGCAYILVEKNEKGTDTTLIETRITAVGFNVCVDNTGAYSGPTNVPDFNDPTLLERRLSITYTQ